MSTCNLKSWGEFFENCTDGIIPIRIKMHTTFSFFHILHQFNNIEKIHNLISENKPASHATKDEMNLKRYLFSKMNIHTIK
jgi:hypothetical protein